MSYLAAIIQKWCKTWKIKYEQKCLILLKKTAAFPQIVWIKLPQWSWCLVFILVEQCEIHAQLKEGEGFWQRRFRIIYRNGLNKKKEYFYWVISTDIILSWAYIYYGFKTYFPRVFCSVLNIIVGIIITVTTTIIIIILTISLINNL